MKDYKIDLHEYALFVYRITQAWYEGNEHLLGTTEDVK